jgi:hypothetical protein
MLSQGRERSGSSYKADIESLTACALVGLAVFPLFGNALALLAHMPRREGQTIVLVVFASLAVYGVYRLYEARMLFRGAMRRRLIYTVLISGGLVAALAIAGIASGTRPSGYAIFAAMVVPLWLSLAVLNLIGWNALPKSA